MTESCAECAALKDELKRLEAVHRLSAWKLDDGRREAEKTGNLDYYRKRVVEIEARLICARAQLSFEEHNKAHGA